MRLSCLCAGKRDSGQERGALLKYSNRFMKRENIREAGTLSFVLPDYGNVFPFSFRYVILALFIKVVFYGAVFGKFHETALMGGVAEGESQLGIPCFRDRKYFFYFSNSTFPMIQEPTPWI